MPTPKYVFINLAKKKAEGKTLNELREEKSKDDKKEKKEKKGKNKAKPFINPNQKILLNTQGRLQDNMRESNRTKILMDLEFAP